MSRHDKVRSPTARLEARPGPFDFDISCCALIVVDMQNAYATKGGYLDLAGFDLSGIKPVIDNVIALSEAARGAEMPVVFLQNGWDAAYVEAGGPLSANQKKSNALRLMREQPDLHGQLLAKGGWDYDLAEGITPQGSDIVVPKSRYSGFVGTQLDSILRSRGVRQLLVCGVATNVCVESTIRDAFGLEYHAVLVREACLHAGPAYLQDASFYNIEKFFGWTAGIDDTIGILSQEQLTEQ